MSWPSVVAIIAGGLFSLGGVALGWVGTLTSEKRRDQRAQAREDAARAQGRGDQKEQFELAHLEVCRKALDRCAALSNKVTEAGEPGAARPDDETVTEARDELHRETLLLLDEDVRLKVESAGEAFDNFFVAISEQKHVALAALREDTTDAWRKATRAVSLRLRAIYEGM